MAHVPTVRNEQRINEIARVQSRFGDQAPQRLAAAQTPEALEGGWEACGGGHRFAPIADNRRNNGSIGCKIAASTLFEFTSDGHDLDSVKADVPIRG